MTREEQEAYDRAQRRIEACRQKVSNPNALDLSELGLTCLPPEIGELSVLKILYLSNNCLKILPPEIGQLSSLTNLVLSGNQLTTLPPEIGQLSSLISLDVRSNNLTSLPLEIGQLSSLVKLQAGDNDLSSLPPEMGQLTLLTQLYLHNNQLTSLPHQIGQLKSLRTLVLEGNQLRELSQSLTNLPSLRELTLHGNQALGLPIELQGPRWLESHRANPPANPQDILRYYYASTGELGQALREMKVLVVGRGGAGKTSVIRRLKGLPFDNGQTETHGIAIEELTLDCTGGPVAARVWDFGGQHVLHAMHEFFFTGRSLYILVLGEREDTAERDAEYWLQLIRSYASNAPVIVVLNKSGGRARELDLPRRKLEDTYGPILGWLATECSDTGPKWAVLLAKLFPKFRSYVDTTDKSGISALKQRITTTVAAMPEIQARFPKKWMQIKDWLSGMKDSYLDYTTYAEHCAELGETDPAKQQELASFLHDLGVALNYRRDPRLHETTVLRPDWLADGIYALLRANDARHPCPLAPDGQINLEQMPAIYAAAERLEMLKAADYPAEKHLFLLRLMGAFQLSFPMDEAGAKHLVPALLSVEEPEGISTTLLDKPVLEMRWEFPVVPGPLMPRLIVRTLGLVMNDWRWRRGAVYQYGPAIAKVWEEKERYIHLRCAAQEPEDGAEAIADLVRMIRGTLREIVAEYKNLKVEEQVRWKNVWLPRTAAEELGLCEPDEEQETQDQEELS